MSKLTETLAKLESLLPQYTHFVAELEKAYTQPDGATIMMKLEVGLPYDTQDQFDALIKLYQEEKDGIREEALRQRIQSALTQSAELFEKEKQIRRNAGAKAELALAGRTFTADDLLQALNELAPGFMDMMHTQAQQVQQQVTEELKRDDTSGLDRLLQGQRLLNTMAGDTSDPEMTREWAEVQQQVSMRQIRDERKAVADLFSTPHVAPVAPSRASASSLEPLPSLAGVNRTGIAKFQGPGSSKTKAATASAAASAEQSQERKVDACP